MILLTPPPVWIQANQESLPGQHFEVHALAWADAVQLVMEDFDSDHPDRIRDPSVAREDRPSLQWLRSAALDEVPVNPFTRGTRSYREAEQVVALFRTGTAQDPALVSAMIINEPGTALALWRWGKRAESASALSMTFRRAWEDKLMEPGLPAMIRGYALRHALCFALSEADERRFESIKAQWSADAGSFLGSFQRLFGLLGGASPQFRFWELPGLQYRDMRLGDLKGFDGRLARRVWICPLIGKIPDIPAGTAWIVPTFSGQQHSAETKLDQQEQKAGEALSAQVKSMGGFAYFAPSRWDLESVGFAFFPILIELEFDGAIKAIRMGDAAPVKP